MERIRFIAIAEISKNTKVRVATQLAASFLVASGALVSTAQAEGPDVYIPLPQRDFYPVPNQAQTSPDLIVNLPPRVPLVSPEPTHKLTTLKKPIAETVWKLDPEISFFGPNLYGNGMACGEKLTKKIEGVASKTLPCGTLVTFEWKGNQLTVPVVDRGPYVKGRMFDLTGGACLLLKHCFTGPIYYRLGK
jgi:hypothetical protein